MSSLTAIILFYVGLYSLIYYIVTRTSMPEFSDDIEVFKKRENIHVRFISTIPIVATKREIQGYVTNSYPADACTPVANSFESHLILLIDLDSNCSLDTKLRHIFRAGYSTLLLYSSTNEDLSYSRLKSVQESSQKYVTLKSISFISKEDAQIIINNYIYPKFVRFHVEIIGTFETPTANQATASSFSELPDFTSSITNAFKFLFELIFPFIALFLGLLLVILLFVGTGVGVFMAFLALGVIFVPIGWIFNAICLIVKQLQRLWSQSSPIATTSHIDSTSPIAPTGPILTTSSIALEEVDKCVICLENLNLLAVRRLICNHVFHTECIKMWVNRKHLCPICRHNITRADPGFEDLQDIPEDEQMITRDQLQELLRQLQIHHNIRRIPPFRFD